MWNLISSVWKCITSDTVSNSTLFHPELWFVITQIDSKFTPSPRPSSKMPVHLMLRRCSCALHSSKSGDFWLRKPVFFACTTANRDCHFILHRICTVMSINKSASIAIFLCNNVFKCIRASSINLFRCIRAQHKNLVQIGFNNVANWKNSHKTHSESVCYSCPFWENTLKNGIQAWE